MIHLRKLGFIEVLAPVGVVHNWERGKRWEPAIWLALEGNRASASPAGHTRQLTILLRRFSVASVSDRNAISGQTDVTDQHNSHFFNYVPEIETNVTRANICE
jgi:hypothetical protein